ncbi:hypothetical protein VPHF86_0185 [Vibrio phage F86]
MRYVTLMLIFMCAFANAHVHDDWATIHRVGLSDHDIIHVASVMSTNRQATLTVDCTDNMTFHEFRRYDNEHESLLYVAFDSDDRYLATDYHESFGHRTKNLDSMSVESRQSFDTRTSITFEVQRSDSTLGIYVFSLRGFTEAHEQLMELCNQ